MLLVTWNVNGLRARFSEVSALANELRPDIICLQEIKATPSQVPEPLTGLPSYHSHYHGGPGGYSGVSLHIHRDLGRPVIESPAFDFETRIAVASVGALRIASVYVPNGGKDYPAKIRFLTGLAQLAADPAADNLIIAGDLNVALTGADVHESMRGDSKIGQRADERAILNRLIESGHHDVLREANAEADDVYTWWPPWRDEKAKNRGWRIDFVLAPPSLAETANRVEVLRERGTSDHAPVAVWFGLSKGG